MLWTVLVACATTEATPPGPLGPPLRWELPDSAPPIPHRLDHHEATAEVCGSPDFGPATVALRWSTFTEGRDAYIVEVSVELVRAGEHLQIEVSPRDTSAAASLLPSDGTWAGLAMVQFACHREARVGLKHHSEQLVDMVPLNADGTVAPPPL